MLSWMWTCSRQGPFLAPLTVKCRGTQIKLPFKMSKVRQKSSRFGGGRPKFTLKQGKCLHTLLCQLVHKLLHLPQGCLYSSICKAQILWELRQEVSSHFASQIAQIPGLCRQCCSLGGLLSSFVIQPRKTLWMLSGPDPEWARVLLVQVSCPAVSRARWCSDDAEWPQSSDLLNQLVPKGCIQNILV